MLLYILQSLRIIFAIYAPESLLERGLQLCDSNTKIGRYKNVYYLPISIASKPAEAS